MHHPKKKYFPCFHYWQHLFLQKSHQLKLDFSPRDGINLLRFAIKRIAQNPDHPVSREAAWQEALERCLTEVA